MWVVPQHPPIILTPNSRTYRTRCSAISSGGNLKTVRPFSDTGNPAFGMTDMGNGE